MYTHLGFSTGPSSKAGTQPSLASSLSAASASRIWACLRDRSTFSSSLLYVTTRYSTLKRVSCGKRKGGVACYLDNLTSSPHSMASLSFPLALFHISRSCWPKMSAQRATLYGRIRPGRQQTLIPHSLTWSARFFASGHSSAVPRALLFPC